MGEPPALLWVNQDAISRTQSKAMHKKELARIQRHVQNDAQSRKKRNRSHLLRFKSLSLGAPLSIKKNALPLSRLSSTSKTPSEPATIEHADVAMRDRASPWTSLRHVGGQAEQLLQDLSKHRSPKSENPIQSHMLQKAPMKSEAPTSSEKRELPQSVNNRHSNQSSAACTKNSEWSPAAVALLHEIPARSYGQEVGRQRPSQPSIPGALSRYDERLLHICESARTSKAVLETDN
ncbi:hypothetical protein LTR84_008801 [Exophiala bonariae]|uniref:Uncharacterized protein n=1 Tax=Exophiala bonariae TaxID=1690606 RepID=A0AAV9MWU5_9EURO|nr:hypothetical protein LTR84_008801 [Exophiala bonariae]